MDATLEAKLAEERREQAEAEAPERGPEREPDADAEREREPEPQPMTEKQLAAISKKLDAESDRHENRMRELIGADFEQYVPCPLCMTDGHVHPAALAQIEPERLDAIQGLLGQGGIEQFELADWLELCPRCKGHGRVRTPSLDPDNMVVHCRECQSRGYRDKVDAQAYYPPPPPAPPAYLPPTNGPAQAWTPPPPPVPYPQP